MAPSNLQINLTFFFTAGELNLQVKGVVQGDLIQQILKDWQLVNQRILSISLSLTIYVQFPKTLKMTRSSVESIASTLGLRTSAN